MIADGGLDWSVKGVVNSTPMGLFWLKCKLDILLVQCYAPGGAAAATKGKYLYVTRMKEHAMGAAQKIPKDGPQEIMYSEDLSLDGIAQTCGKFF